jgi:superfamily I DNA/RNA helicase
MYTPQYVAQLRYLGVPYIVGHKPANGLEHVASIRAWESLRAGRSVATDIAARALGHIPIGADIDGDVFVSVRRSSGTITLNDLGSRVRTRAPWDHALLKINPDDINYLQRIQAAGRKADDVKVRISTIHAAKGQEATHVILHTGVTRRVARSMTHPSQFMDEVRVQYVGVTRAKERLTFVGTEHPWYSPEALR